MKSPNFVIEQVGGNIFSISANRKQIARIHYHLTNIISYKEKLYLVETPYTNDEQKFVIYPLGHKIIPEVNV